MEEQRKAAQTFVEIDDADRMTIRGRELTPDAVPILIQRGQKPYRHAEE
jgi:hypothetical protein